MLELSVNVKGLSHASFLDAFSLTPPPNSSPHLVWLPLGKLSKNGQRVQHDGSATCERRQAYAYLRTDVDQADQFEIFTSPTVSLTRDPQSNTWEGTVDNVHAAWLKPIDGYLSDLAFACAQQEGRENHRPAAVAA